ncbi:hypothetical protein MHK_001191, partial [Candidatus Magnetomorum sp. HK-1]
STPYSELIISNITVNNDNLLEYHISFEEIINLTKELCNNINEKTNSNTELFNLEICLWNKYSSNSYWDIAKDNMQKYDLLNYFRSHGIFGISTCFHSRELWKFIAKNAKINNNDTLSDNLIYCFFPTLLRIKICCNILNKFKVIVSSEDKLDTKELPDSFYFICFIIGTFWLINDSYQLYKLVTMLKQLLVF